MHREKPHSVFAVRPFDECHCRSPRDVCVFCFYYRGKRRPPPPPPGLPQLSSQGTLCGCGWKTDCSWLVPSSCGLTPPPPHAESDSATDATSPKNQAVASLDFRSVNICVFLLSNEVDNSVQLVDGISSDLDSPPAEDRGIDNSPNANEAGP